MNVKKSIYLTLIFIATFSFATMAQTENKPINITLHGGLSEYMGDLGNGFFDFKQSNPMGGASLGIYLSPSINFALQSTFGTYGYKATKGTYNGRDFFGNKLDAAMLIEYKFNNGYLMQSDSKLSPFLSVGMGFANYTDVVEKIDVFPLDFIAPIAAGVKYHINDAFALQYKYQFNFTNNDTHDRLRAQNYNDKFGQHMIGVALSFGAKKKPTPETPFIDSDGDGVPDHLDRCPDTPRDVAVDKYGCPLDRDGDGVPDYLDKCPDIPGPISNDGCPEEVTEMIELLGKIQFEFDSQVIKVESFPLLDNAYKVLLENPTYKLIIEGHTDNIGEEDYNQDLSERRAKAVFYYLTLKGIDTNRVKASGFGSKKPIADNKTAEGRAKNRRIEFKVTL